jgi:hypothetical protein
MPARWLTAAAVLAGLESAALAESGPSLPQRRTIDRIYKAIAAHRLTSLGRRCYSLVAGEPEKAGEFMVDVREVHGRACGGCPDTDGLRMFSIRVLPSGSMLNDALSEDGSEYLPLR